MGEVTQGQSRVLCTVSAWWQTITIPNQRPRACTGQDTLLKEGLLYLSPHHVFSVTDFLKLKYFPFSVHYDQLAISDQLQYSVLFLLFQCLLLAEAVLSTQYVNSLAKFSGAQVFRHNPIDSHLLALSALPLCIQ